MNKTEWMQHYKLDAEEMVILEKWLLGTNGKIVAVVDNPERKVLGCPRT